MKNNKSDSGAVGPVGVVIIVLVVLKLTHQIDWSWLWVLSPLIVWLCVLIGLAAVMIAFNLFSNGAMSVM
jgi:hypothetical protein